MWTQEQADVILHQPQSAVVFASPGSGKTSVLTEHLRHVMDMKWLKPTSVMAVTFTRQSAMEMRARLLRSDAEQRIEVEAMRIGTFHAQLFQALLRDRPDIPVVLHPQEQFQLVRHALQGNSGANAQTIRRCLSFLARHKAAWPREALSRRTYRWVHRYEKLKTNASRWDFDDILIEFAERLGTNNSAMAHFRDIQYLLVDEFQDTNPIQWHISLTLARSLGIPMFVVGDEDQSIYGFRGADPAWLLQFTQFVPSSHAFALTTNFRSDRQIVDKASQLIRHNRVRTQKPMNVSALRDGVCRAYQHVNEQMEAHFVAASITKQLRVAPTSSIAVLARTRGQLHAVWSALQPDSRVQFRTFHDAKGKEWDVVHIVGAVQDNPYLPALVRGLQGGARQWKDPEEERRLFYVAMTRARHGLHVHVPRFIHKGPVKPVIFIAEAGIDLERSVSFE